MTPGEARKFFEEHVEVLNVLACVRCDRIFTNDPRLPKEHSPGCKRNLVTLDDVVAKYITVTRRRK